MDPEDEDTGEAVGTRNDERIAKLNQIGMQADAERADQFMDVNDDDTTSPFVVDGADTTDADAVEAAAAAEDEAARLAAENAAADAAKDEPPAAKYKIKVNGVEKELTLDEVLERAQKTEAADDKFREAAKLRKEAESLAPVTPPVKDAPPDDREDLLALARALQVGTEDEAVAALRKLKGPAAPPAPRVDELYQVIDAKLAFNEANRIFRDEFSDVVSDPRLERMVMERDAELISAEDKRPYLERYREIGAEVRAWRDSLAKPAPATEGLTKKEERKAAAPAVPPVASGKAKQVVADEEPEESAQDVIAKMGKARGGPQWMRG